MELKHKVAIVTGAVGAIGRGICTSLSQQGMRIVVADLDLAACEHFVGELLAQGVDALGVAVDVTSKASVERMAERALSYYGQIDALINNAGVIEVAPLVEFSEEKWDRVMAVNLKGTFFCAQVVAPTMIAQKRGRIVNFASVAAKRPAPLLTAYAATKHGIVGMTQVWCQELGPFNITVNTVCPGFVDSPMWSQKLGPAFAQNLGVSAGEVVNALAKSEMPLGRTQQPKDIGEAVAYLCAADNVTGQSLVVDGGLTRY